MIERLKLEEGWSTFLLVCALVCTAAAVLVAAELMEGLELLMLIGLFGVFTGLILAKSSFSNNTAHIFALVYGFALIAFLIGRTLPGDMEWRERILDLFTRQFLWLNKAFSGGTSRDGLIFLLQTAGIFWLLGYTAAWYTFRRLHVWRVVLPTGLVLLSSVYYYYGPKPLAVFVAAYVLVALVYIARTHLVVQEREWRAGAVRYERGDLRRGFMRASFLIAVLALLVAWSTPVLGANARVGDALYEANQPWRKLQDNWTRLFSSLRSYGTGTNDPYLDTLVLGGPRSVGSELIMDIYVNQRLPYIYWQALALDTYDGQGGWSASELESVVHIPDEGVLNTPFESGRQVITQTVRNYLNNSSTLYGAPAIIGSDRQMLVDFRYDEGGNMLVNGVRSRYVLRAGDRYNVQSTVSVADESSLRAASSDYPAWIEEIYLQMPETITPETVDLAVEITAPYDNAYDKASAVQRYLRENISYDDQIDAPPEGVEPVHYTLFVSKRAYCTYYASAMTMMLRSQGIPARIVNGYAQGEFVEDANVYRVRANNAHTWVEVYFPQYGWIQFEPTASIPVVARPESADAGDGSDPNTVSAVSDLDREALLGEEELNPAEDPTDLLQDLPRNEGADEAALSAQARLLWLVRGGVGLLVLALAGAALLLAGRYNRRVEASVEGSYSRLESWSNWLGVTLRPVETPYERADRLAVAVPAGKTPIRNLTQYYVLSRFSPGRGADQQIDPAAEWRALRPVFLRESIRRRLQRFSRSSTRK